MLARHVADVELQQLAVSAGDADHARRVVGVHMHLHELGLTNHEHRVAKRLDVLADSLHVELLTLDEELGAVTPATFGQVHRDLRGLHLGWHGDDDVDFLDALEHALEDDLQPETAGVDHARVAKDLQLAWGLEHRGARPRRRSGNHACRGGVGSRRGDGGGPAGFSRDREDRALGRPVDRTVSGVGRLFERGRQLLGLQRCPSLHRAGEAAKDLREDHARVAARAHEASVRREASDRVGLLDVFDRRLERQQHVGAGVAVGHREHVEAVDLLLVGSEPVQASEQCLLEERTVHSGGPGRSPQPNAVLP